MIHCQSEKCGHHWRRFYWVRTGFNGTYFELKTLTVLEHTPRVLGRSVAPLVSDYIANIHRENGIKIETGVFINEFVGEHGKVTGVKCAHGVIPARTGFGWCRCNSKY